MLPNNLDEQLQQQNQEKHTRIQILNIYIYTRNIVHIISYHITHTI